MRGPFVFAVCLCAARLAAADGEWTRTAEATVESKFVRRGIERAGTSLRTAAWAANEAWKLDAWLNLPFEHARRAELGARVSYAHVLGSGVRLSAEVALFRFGDAGAGHASQTSELTAALSLPAGPGRASVSFTRDVERCADVGELSYSGEHALKNWGAFLNYRVYAGFVDATDVLPRLGSATRVADAYSYHGVDLAVPYRIGGQTVVTAGAHYAGTAGARPFWSPDGPSMGAKIWLSLAASYEF